ncbi:glycoside hydrolase family protein [Capnocytophaga cynodegmi]|uniref:hypothetical protein n=1 Tax=Capnocytophaga cynodegmi TaxID=28189 RepID=UPI00385EED4E
MEETINKTEEINVLIKQIEDERIPGGNTKERLAKVLREINNKTTEGGTGLTPEQITQLRNTIQKDPEAIGKVLLANGETLSREELKGDKGDTGERGQRGERGLQGEQGIQGADGKSAYQLWIDSGNQGTEQDFLNSLKGEGFTEEEKQQLIKKGATKDVLLADGTTISKEGLLGGQTSIPDDQFEFKFEQNWLLWKLKTEASSAWKKLLYNYELRPFDNQVLIGKIIDNKIYIKKQGWSDEKYKHLLLGQWQSSSRYKFVDNQMQWHSGNYKAEWTDMPFHTTEESRHNTEGRLQIRANTLRYAENYAEVPIKVTFPEEFHIKLLDGHCLLWKRITEDETQWKFLPFHGDNFNNSHVINARVKNGIIQYKFDFEEDNEYKDLVKTKDLFPSKEIKVVSNEDVVGDARDWLNVILTHNRNILIKSGTYNIMPLTHNGLIVPSNTTLTFEVGAKIKVLPNPLPHCSVLRIDKVQNVSIFGKPTITGDKNEHQWMNPKEDNYYYRSEQIHGVAIYSSENVYVENLVSKDFIGDAMILSNSRNVYVKNTKLLNSRMENLGIRSCEDVTFDYCEFSFASPAEASNFKNLGYGVDIEPLYNRLHIRKLKFINCIFERNRGFLPVGLMISLSSHGMRYYENKSQNEMQPTFVSIELINPVFKGCGIAVSVPTNWTHGELKMFNVTVIESDFSGIHFTDVNSENFKVFIDGLRLIDCATQLHQIGGETAHYSRPISFYSTPNRNPIATGLVPNHNKGTKNITIKNIDIINTGKVPYKKAPITNYAVAGKENDLMNVELENVKVVGYLTVFENLSKTPVHQSFRMTLHPECILTDVTGDVILTNDSKHTFLNKKDVSNVTFSNNISPSNLEYYVKNSSTGEVKLKFESATDIEGLAYGVQEFTLARGKRLKMRKIAANRWEYLEGTV